MRSPDLDFSCEHHSILFLATQILLELLETVVPLHDQISVNVIPVYTQSSRWTRWLRGMGGNVAGQLAWGFCGDDVLRLLLLRMWTISLAFQPNYSPFSMWFTLRVLWLAQMQLCKHKLTFLEWRDFLLLPAIPWSQTIDMSHTQSLVQCVVQMLGYLVPTVYQI